MSDRYAHRDPDPTRARNRMCTAKIGYPSQANARRIIKDMARRKNVKDLQVYKCSFCAMWHVGNKQDKAKKKALRRQFDARNTGAESI